MWVKDMTKTHHWKGYDYVVREDSTGGFVAEFSGRVTESMPLPSDAKVAAMDLIDDLDQLLEPSVCSDCGCDLWYEYDPEFPLCEDCWPIYYG